MLIKLAWRNLWRNRLRTGIMLSAIAFGLVGVVVMMGYMTGMTNNMIHNAVAWQTSHIQIQHKEYLIHPDIKLTLNDESSLLHALQSDPEVQAWSRRFLVDGMIATARSNRGVTINGIDSEAERLVTPLAQNIVQGDYLSRAGRNPILVSQKNARRLRLKIGSKVILTFSDAAGQVTGAAFRVRGIFRSPSAPFDEKNVYVRRNDLQRAAAMSGMHQIAVLLKGDEALQQGGLLQAVQRRLAGHAGATTEVRNWLQVQPLLASMIANMDVSNAIMLAIFLLAMGFGIVNVMLMSVFERTREFGVLMAVGMQKHRVFLLIVLESCWLGICGAGVGLLLCYLLMLVLGYTGLPLTSMAEGLGAYGIDTVLYPEVSLTEYQLIFMTVVVVSALAALYPARQIVRLPPAGAMAEKH